MPERAQYRHTNRRALLIFVMTLALGVSVLGVVVNALQKKYLHDEARAQLQTELALLGDLSVEPLLRSDYAAVERLVHAWVARRPHPVQITAVAPNGFVLVEVRNGDAPENPFVVVQPVSYGARQLFTLRAVADVSTHAHGVLAIARDAALVGVAMVLMLGWALWRILQRTAIRPLEREIHEREKNEHVLRERTTELELAVEELESFSYSVSHDLRTPLRSIDGYSHVLLDDYASVLDAQGQHYLGRIRDAAQRMGLLIDDLLGLARVVRLEPKRAVLDLSVMAREVLARSAQAEPRRQVEIRIKDGLSAQADPTLMGMVLENLLGNAWKYTAQTPHAIIEFGVQQHAGEAVFYVRDNGAGFDMQFADKLFAPFQRLHGAEYPGTGIGLATVRRIIQRHGGRIWAESRVDCGATFYFTLP